MSGKCVCNAQRPILDTILVILLLWGWAFPSTFFWEKSTNNNIILPHIPYIIWFLPGELWRFSPEIHIIIFLASPILYYLFYGRRSCFSMSTKITLITIIILISFIHILWGLSLY